MEGLLHAESWNARTGREFFFQFHKGGVRRDPCEKLAEGGIEKSGFGEIGICGGGRESSCGGRLVTLARKGEPAQEIRVGRGASGREECECLIVPV